MITQSSRRWTQLWCLVLGLVVLVPPVLQAQEKSTSLELFSRIRAGDESALQALKKAAESGDADSQFQLGRAYSFGGPILKSDFDLAAKWAEKAAMSGNLEAQSNMGYLYSIGQGVPKDAVKAISWWQRCAEQGFVQCQFNLGLAYDQGNLVPKDPDKAFYWMNKAAMQGAAVAQVTVGMMHGRGIGTREDPKEALAWYRKAAAQGNEIAMTNIGSMYANGEVVTKDPAEALRWLEKPVSSGDPRALGIRTLICVENAGLCREAGGGKYFVHESTDPKFRISIPNLPPIRLAVHPSQKLQPHLRFMGTDGPYNVSILTPTADAGMTARECAISGIKNLAGGPGSPGMDNIYRAQIDDNTFIAQYAMPAPGGAILQAHLFSAAGGTHCVQVHVSKASASKSDIEPWFKGFGKAKFETNF